LCLSGRQPFFQQTFSVKLYVNKRPLLIGALEVLMILVFFGLSKQGEPTECAGGIASVFVNAMTDALAVLPIGLRSRGRLEADPGRRGNPSGK
jgi:hypothetical protein